GNGEARIGAAYIANQSPDHTGIFKRCHKSVLPKNRATRIRRSDRAAHVREKFPSHAVGIFRPFGSLSLSELGGIAEVVECPLLAVDAQYVAGSQAGDRAAVDGFGGQMDGGRDLARGARHAAV